VAAFEGLGYACRETGFLYAMASQVFGIQMAIKLAASEELKTRYLPPLISGKAMAAYAFTEEESGSDAFSMQGFARETDQGFVLNATKRFITNGPYADLCIVFARTSEGRNPFALTAFLVDMKWNGARHGREYEKVGYRTVHMGELVFENVLVPKSHVIGAKGTGLRVLAESTGWERGILVANALGPMARGVDECVQRARTRQQYGKPIGAFQGVSSRIANMILRHRLCRMAVYDMASKVDDGRSIQPYLMDAAMTKLFVSENYIQLELDAVQIYGVRGILLEYFPQQDLRDSLTSTIWAGTSETLRNIIAKFADLPVE
jgi:alkylation response protein AidB-like acyl-CoA dehydrogenase